MGYFQLNFNPCHVVRGTNSAIPISHRTVRSGMNKVKFTASSSTRWSLLQVLPPNREMFNKRPCAFETSIAQTLRLNEMNRKNSRMAWERQASGWSSFSHCATESSNNTPEMRTFRQSFPIVLDLSHSVSSSFFLPFFISVSLSLYPEH
jgi:hypothetical protein